MRRLTLLAFWALVAASGTMAQDGVEAPKPAGSPARPVTDFRPPSCAQTPDLLKLDALLGRWNDAYLLLQSAIAAEVAASHVEGLAQGDDDRAKDEVSWNQTNILLLQTEIGVRQKQIQVLDASLKASGRSGPLSDKDYLASRENLRTALQNAITGFRDRSAAAQTALAKAQGEVQNADQSLNSAQEKFAATAQDSRQASQADRAAEDAFQTALQAQRGRTCPAAQSGGNGLPAPAPIPAPTPAPIPAASPSPEPGPPPPAAPPLDLALPPPANAKAPVEPGPAAPSALPPAPIATEPVPEPAAKAEAPSPLSLEPTSATVACSASKLEAEVLAEINRARTGPVAFAKVLAPEFGGGSNSDAVRFLKAQTPVLALVCDGRLEAAARKQLADQGPLGGESHIGSDGSEPWKRMQDAGVSARLYAEEISVTFPTALGTVSQLLIDPTPTARKHGPAAPPAVHQARLDLMNTDYQAVGVGCGANKKYKVMCVVDLSSRPLAAPAALQTPP